MFRSAHPDCRDIGFRRHGGVDLPWPTRSVHRFCAVAGFLALGCEAEAAAIPPDGDLPWGALDAAATPAGESCYAD